MQKQIKSGIVADTTRWSNDTERRNTSDTANTDKHETLFTKSKEEHSVQSAPVDISATGERTNGGAALETRGNGSISQLQARSFEERRGGVQETESSYNCSSKFEVLSTSSCN